MNETALNLQLEMPCAILSSSRPTPLSAWLPYAALAVTVAAFSFNAPMKLSALMKSKLTPQTASATNIVPTSVNYPVPAQSIWIDRPDIDGSMVAHR